MAADVPAGSKGTGIVGSLSELVSRRWLLVYFIQRQITQNYRGSFLGLTWIVVGPLLMVALYTLVFSEIVGLRVGRNDSVSNYGLYIYSGLLPFFVFSETVNKSAASIRGNSGLVKRVIFPLEVLPIATVASAFVGMVFGLVALSFLLLLFEGSLQWTTLLIPIIAVPQAIFMFAVAFLVTVIGAYLPDFREALTSLTRVMLFATPIIWTPDLAYERGLGFLVDFNPLAIVVISYRDLLLEGVIPDPIRLGLFTLFSLALLAVGVALFVRAKASFADVV